MKNTYQIKINQGKDAKVLDVSPAGTKGQPVTIKAEPAARYQLVDNATKFAPENIRASRQGKDLKISFEGSNTTDLVIENYYGVSADGFNGLIGEAESGKFYEYIPENASGMASVPMLAESGQAVGLALGGQEVAPAGAAVGVLAAGLFSPWLLGAGAVGLAAAGGGGGGGSTSTDTTAPTGQTGALSPVAGSDSSTLGDNKTNVTKPTITGKAEAGSTVEISFVDPAGKVTGPYKTTADANGNYSLLVPDNLVDNAATTDTKGTLYTPVIKATDASGNSSTANGTPFLVDTKAVPVLSVAINVDANNDGLISAAEKGTATTTSVTAQLDKTKVVAGDVVTFSDGTNSKSVTLNDTDIASGQVTSTGWTIPGEGLASTISAVLKDLAGNVSDTVKDMVTMVINSLKTALTIDPISTDNIISTTESVATALTVTGKVTGSFAAKDKVVLALNGKDYTAEVGADGSYTTQVSMADFKADPDAKLEGSVVGTNGNTATAAQSYVLEAESTSNKTTGLSIDTVTSDNIINATEASVSSLNVTGKVTGKFIANDQVTLSVNGKSYLGLVQSDGKFSSTVAISDLLADVDTIIDATVTGTGGTSAKALQDYGIDTTAASNLALSIDLDSIKTGSTFGNDGFINSTEKGTATTTGLTASFDSSSVSIGDVVTFSDGTTTKTVVLTGDMVTAGSATSTGWALPLENVKLSVSAVLKDAAGNNSNTATDFATVDTNAATVSPKTTVVTGSLLSEVEFKSNESGTFKLHVGNDIFTSIPSSQKLFSNEVSVVAKTIFFEHFDAAGNSSTTFSFGNTVDTVFKVDSNTLFII